MYLWYVLIPFLIFITAFFGFCFAIVISFYAEIQGKLDTLNAMVNDPTAKFPIHYRAELTGWGTRVMCKMDTISPRFHEILDDCTKFDSDGACWSGIHYDILEKSVELRIDVYER